MTLKENCTTKPIIFEIHVLAIQKYYCEDNYSTDITLYGDNAINSTIVAMLLQF